MTVGVWSIGQREVVEIVLNKLVGQFLQGVNAFLEGLCTVAFLPGLRALAVIGCHFVSGLVQVGESGGAKRLPAALSRQVRGGRQWGKALGLQLCLVGLGCTLTVSGLAVRGTGMVSFLGQVFTSSRGD
jgi:hypothetical protein